MGMRVRGKYVGEIPDIDHKELVNVAFRYLKYSQGCSVVFKERVASTSEQPDAIGFSGGYSWVIECKASRADFLSDSKKHFRRRPESGMGMYRYYMAPRGLLSIAEIPDNWGLIEVGEKKRKYRELIHGKDAKPFTERNMRDEISYLVSSIRRIDVSMAVFIEPKD